MRDFGSKPYATIVPMLTAIDILRCFKYLFDQLIWITWECFAYGKIHLEIVSFWGLSRWGLTEGTFASFLQLRIVFPSHILIFEDLLQSSNDKHLLGFGILLHVFRDVITKLSNQNVCSWKNIDETIWLRAIGCTSEKTCWKDYSTLFKLTLS